MMKNIDTLIEQYIQGNMSLEEEANFEELISQNPEIKSEVSMQNKIIEAIKETRRIELKTKLMQINPNTVSLLTQKIAIATSTFVISALVGIGIYSLARMPEKNTPNNFTVETQQVSIADDYNIKSLEIEKNISEKIGTISTPENETNTTAVAPRNLTKTSNANETIVKANSQKEFDPTKQFLAAKDEKELGQDENLPLEKQNNLHNEETLEIKTDPSYSYLAYQYDGKQLSLLGEYKTGSEAYVIEKKAGMMVLKYDNKVYQIITSKKIEKLENHLITDLKLLEALK